MGKAREGERERGKIVLLKKRVFQKRKNNSRRGNSTHFRTSADIIWDSGAASMIDCQVLVEFAITNPNSKKPLLETLPFQKDSLFQAKLVQRMTRREAHLP